MKRFWLVILCACNALPAMEIGDDSNGFSFLKIIIAGFVYRGSQFMTKYPRVFEIRLCAFECVQIGTANADSFYFENGMILLQGRLFRFLVFELSRLYANK